MKISFISISLFLLLLVSNMAGQGRSTASAAIKINIVKAASVSLNKAAPDENLASLENKNSKLRDVIVDYQLVPKPNNEFPKTRAKSEEVDFIISNSPAFKLNREENQKIRKIDRTLNLNISFKNPGVNRNTNHKIAVTIVY